MNEGYQDEERRRQHAHQMAENQRALEAQEAAKRAEAERFRELCEEQAKAARRQQETIDQQNRELQRGADELLRRSNAQAAQQWEMADNHGNTAPGEEPKRDNYGGGDHAVDYFGDYLPKGSPRGFKDRPKMGFLEGALDDLKFIAANNPGLSDLVWAVFVVGCAISLLFASLFLYRAGWASVRCAVEPSPAPADGWLFAPFICFAIIAWCAWRSQRETFRSKLALGVLVLASGAALWLGPAAAHFPLLVLFVLATIAGYARSWLWLGMLIAGMLPIMFGIYSAANSTEAMLPVLPPAVLLLSTGEPGSVFGSAGILLLGILAIGAYVRSLMRETAPGFFELFSIAFIAFAVFLAIPATGGFAPFSAFLWIVVTGSGARFVGGSAREAIVSAAACALLCLTSELVTVLCF